MESGLDIAEQLRTNIDYNEWKGDTHTHGIYFTKDKGYLISKVLAARIHRETCSVDDLFYSFDAIDEDGFPIVRREYPFQHMEAKPRKYHLMFEEEELPLEKLDDLFEIPFTQTWTFAPLGIIDVIQHIGKKRDRERSMVNLHVADGKMHVQVKRRAGRRQDILAEGMVDVELSEPQVRTDAFVVNAHTLSYVLEIFSLKPYVKVSVARDRIMVTEGDTSCIPYLEVLISKMRTRL